MFEYIIKKPKISTLFIILLTIVGMLTFFQLPQREIPEITVDMTTVTVPYPGASAEEVERNVTNPLESSLQGINGIDNYSSVSASGASTVVLEIEDGADRTKVLSNIRQAVSNAEAEFPEEAMQPVITDDTQMGALASYHLLSSERENLYELNGLIDEWSDTIRSIPGVEDTTIKGLPDEEITIIVSIEDLSENGLQVPDVIAAVEGELDTLPPGLQESEGELVQLTLPLIEDPEELNELYIGQSIEEEAVYLEDIGTVEVLNERPEDLVSYEQVPAVSFTVLPEEGVDIPSVYEAVNEEMMLLAQELPEEVSLDLLYTQQTIIDEIFGDLSVSFLFSILAVIVVTLLGLNLAAAFIVSFAIPISIFIGMVPLPFLQVDLNQISIIGFIIALGILVDDAIVVSDNIQRKYQEGSNPLKGALTGSKEVRSSIITSTLAIVFTFLPLLFISGANGDFIRAMPSVLITTIIASTIVSLSLVPVFLVWREKRRQRKNKEGENGKKNVPLGILGKQLDRLAGWYSNVILKKVVKHPWKTGITGLILCTLAYGLIPFIPVVFFPSADRPEVMVEVRLPAGTTIEETEATLYDMAGFVLEEEENITEYAIYAGSGLPPLFGEGMSNTGEETGEMLFRVDRDITSSEEVINRWESPLQEEFPDAVIEFSTIEAGPPVGAPIAITVKGPELDTINEIGEDLQEFIGELPETGTVVDDQGSLQPAYHFQPDREMMAEHGITLQEISQQISLTTAGMPLGELDDGQTRRELRFVLTDGDQGIGNLDEVPDFSEIEMPSRNVTNEMGAPEILSLDELVTMEETSVIPRISHEDGERTLTVRVQPAGDQDALENQIEEYAEELRDDYSGYTINVGGEQEERTDFFLELLTLFIVVVFLIYIVMAVQFNSLLLPILIMSTVYLAVTGAVIGLFITQTGLGFMAMMGIVSLAGIVVRNSVVLIEFMEQRLADGYALEDAVTEAGRVRLRPILLTAVTAIAALLPVALSGDVLFVPLSIAIISGLIFSALFTVVIVPAFYTIIKR